MSLISIIIPYYKKIDYIEKTILSILNQTYTNFEIIIVYDDPNLKELDLLKKITFHVIISMLYVLTDILFCINQIKNIPCK